MNYSDTYLIPEVLVECISQDSMGRERRDTFDISHDERVDTHTHVRSRQKWNIDRELQLMSAHLITPQLLALHSTCHHHHHPEKHDVVYICWVADFSRFAVRNRKIIYKQFFHDLVSQCGGKKWLSVRNKEATSYSATRRGGGICSRAKVKAHETFSADTRYNWIERVVVQRSKQINRE